MVHGADFAIGRVKTVDSRTAGNPEVPAPVPAYDPTLVQPPQCGTDVLYRQYWWQLTAIIDHSL